MKNNSTHKIKQVTSCIIMALALAWLTISIPFVYASQQHMTTLEQLADISTEIDIEEDNPFANTTEEKTERGGNALSEEYLHDMHLHIPPAAVLEKYSKCHPSDLYYAFHPELISPPPEFVLS